MTGPATWDEAYLLSSLPAEEADWLEVKGSGVFDPSKNDVDRGLLSKAICALANSGGGILVLGLRKGENGWIVDNGGISIEFRKPSTREWLEDVIPTLADLPIHSFNVYAITGGQPSSQIQSRKAVFALEIRDSELAPHQALDNKYYARVGGKSRPIGHRLVMDILGRRREPAMDVKMHFAYMPTPSMYALRIVTENVGRVYAKYVSIFVFVPKHLVHSPEGQLHFHEVRAIEGVSYAVFRKSNITRDPIQQTAPLPDLGPVRYDPILPGLHYTNSIVMAHDFAEKRLYLRDARILWQVHADNAPARSGSVLAREIPFPDA